MNIVKPFAHFDCGEDCSMSKGHRDNHAARVKRGPVAFAKKAKRRAIDKIPCLRCGQRSRPSVMDMGLCPLCVKVPTR